MSTEDDEQREPTPHNPLCPICGAADWVSDPRWVHLLGTAYADTNRLVETEGQPHMIPLEWFICRVCRFVRLHSAGGDLIMRFPPE